jgi:general L-amino acid transport system permease protein
MTEQTKLNYIVGEHPDLPAPASTTGVMGWVRTHLISTPTNTVLTLLGLYLIYLIVPPVLNWAFFSANFTGELTKESCTDDGACWVFIRAWFKFLMYGRYPETELWRINLAYIIGGIPLLGLILPGTPFKKWISIYLLVIYPIICFFLFVGDSFGLMLVETPLWGGLFLTLVIGIVGIIASLPIGIVLALGRRSHMPAVRAVCVAFIELWRGVPLITVLFMSSVMFPLFMPEGVHIDKLLRALVGVALFSSAYMAEVVRGGLQAIPKGQYEAASALGLSYWKTMGFIIMPQALKLVIPAIVSTFIGLFKDTTLVLIIGLFDLLGAAQAANTNPNWAGYSEESYVFAAFVFWCFCFSMSRYSVHLERKLHTGH